MPGPEPEESDERLLRLIALHKYPFVTAADIVEDLSIEHVQTRKRLDAMVQAGLLNTRKAGRTKVYWLTAEGRQSLAVGVDPDSSE
jgi:predicted ArsR family transcriptional regulator